MVVNKDLGNLLLNVIVDYIKENYSIESSEKIECLDILEFNIPKDGTIKLRILFYQPNAQYIKNYYQIYLKLIDKNATKDHMANQNIIGYFELHKEFYVIKDLTSDKEFITVLFHEIEKNSELEKEKKYLGDNFKMNLIAHEKIQLNPILSIANTSPRYISIFCDKYIVKILKTIKPIVYSDEMNIKTWKFSKLSTKLVLPLRFVLTLPLNQKAYFVGYASNYYTDAINLGEIAKNSLRAFYSSKDLNTVNITPQFIQMALSIAELHNNLQSIHHDSFFCKDMIKKSDFIRDISLMIHKMANFDSSKNYFGNNFLEIANKTTNLLLQKYDNNEDTILTAESLGNCNLYQMLKISNKIVMRNIYTYRSLLSIRSSVYNSKYWDLGNIKNSTMWYAYSIAAEFVDTSIDTDTDKRTGDFSAEKWINFNWEFFINEYKKHSSLSDDKYDQVLINLIGVLKLLDDTFIYYMTGKKEKHIAKIYKNMMKYYIKLLLSDINNITYS